MRAVIYARYSSDNQRRESIEDQLEVCRRYITRMGWTLTGTYDDAAMSGSSRFRPGFQKLLADAEERRFDVVVCEALDRLSRKLADTADFYDRLTFRRVKLYTTNMGEITTMHIGVIGMMAQSYISDLKEKTHRGQLGRARAGKIPGGLAYGYEVIPPPAGATGAGERRIIPGEADIVRRIFRDYAAGRSARTIARELNAERIPGPGGRLWGDTTIRGQVERGTGILNNTLYIGQLSWNRCSYVKDPATGKRLARPNPQSEWEVADVPELRLLDQDLWDAARARQANITYTMARNEAGHALNRAHRRQFLLSGLLTCGCCGGAMTVTGKDRYGCATRRGKGTCTNTHTINRQRIETRVLSALRERMVTPVTTSARQGPKVACPPLRTSLWWQAVTRIGGRLTRLVTTAGPKPAPVRPRTIRDSAKPNVSQSYKQEAKVRGESLAAAKSATTDRASRNASPLTRPSEPAASQRRLVDRTPPLAVAQQISGDHGTTMLASPLSQAPSEPPKRLVDVMMNFVPTIMPTAPFQEQRHEEDPQPDDDMPAPAPRLT